MRVYTVDLKEKYSFLQGGKLECILMDYPMDGENPNWKRPAVVVVPGGGYACVSKREGDPIAAEFFAQGFQAFVLTYEVTPVAYPEQLLELAAAVDYIKANAKELNVNADEVFAVGFSAGGHLTGNLAVEYQSVSEKAGTPLNAKPTAVGLAYPVISILDGHCGSYTNLLAGYTEEAREELLKTLNLNQAVTKDTPPAYIWTTANDQIVPCVNLFGWVGAEAAYRYGEPWRLGVLAYLRRNRDLMEQTAAQWRLPLCRLEATYLAFMDCTELLPYLNNETPAAFFLRHGVAVHDGDIFGKPGWVRINLATQTALLKQAFERMGNAIAALPR
jgi:acetyl esterase/lipase